MSIPDFQLRKCMTKLRISTHNLKIERGCYAIPQIPAESRICMLCTNQEVEDEFHFLLKCPVYNEERVNLMSSVAFQVPNFPNLDEYDKFMYLLSCADNIALLTAKFVQKCFTKRENAIM